MQVPMLQLFLNTATQTSLAAIQSWFGMETLTL
jgi:hypothetical protein